MGLFLTTLHTLETQVLFFNVSARWKIISTERWCVKKSTDESDD
jgi:hypothetical protein